MGFFRNLPRRRGHSLLCLSENTTPFPGPFDDTVYTTKWRTCVGTNHRPEPQALYILHSRPNLSRQGSVPPLLGLCVPLTRPLEHNGHPWMMLPQPACPLRHLRSEHYTRASLRGGAHNLLLQQSPVTRRIRMEPRVRVGPRLAEWLRPPAPRSVCRLSHRAGPPGHLRLCLQGRPGLRGAGSMGPTCSSAESTCPGQSSEAESTGSIQWSEAVSVGPTRATGPIRLLGAGSMGPTCSSAESTCPGQSSEAESTGSTQWSEAVSGGPTRSSEAFSAGPNLSAGDPLAQGALPTDTTFKVSAPQIGDDNSQVTPPSDPAHGGSAGSADSASGFAIPTVDTPGGSTLCAENPSRRGSAQSTDIAPWLAVSDTAPLEECTRADDLAT
ncbi:hypothetical protein ACOMHN_062741 [Nucella lapillus]